MKNWIRATHHEDINPRNAGPQNFDVNQEQRSADWYIAQWFNSLNFP